ncbi:MAG: hypothetical protein U0163_18255 [Gemmatimonadaceae bacterium]
MTNEFQRHPLVVRHREQRGDYDRQRNHHEHEVAPWHFLADLEVAHPTGQHQRGHRRADREQVGEHERAAHEKRDAAQ